MRAFTSKPEFLDNVRYIQKMLCFGERSSYVCKTLVTYFAKCYIDMMDIPKSIGLGQGKKYVFKKQMPLILGAFAVVIAGIVTGWILTTEVMVGGASSSTNDTTPGVKQGSKEAGILDPNFEYDSVEGVLKSGGIDNEGTHHLEREGGPSKNVYLTSSVIDLESFVGKKVEIWGETQAARKAGWLMEVAKVKVLE